MPDCRFVSVVRPMTCSGFVSSKRGSFAVPVTRASLASFTPGQMHPPRNTPPSPTTPNVVAVPKSMKIVGAPYSSYAATAFAIRSLPSSRGFS